MLVHKCDRCGFVYEDYAEQNRAGNNRKFNAVRLVNQYLNGNYGDRTSFELCPGCTTMLWDWLTGLKKEDSKK